MELQDAMPRHVQCIEYSKDMVPFAHILKLWLLRPARRANGKRQAQPALAVLLPGQGIMNSAYGTPRHSFSVFFMRKWN